MSTGGGFFEFREKMAAAKIAKPQAAVVPASPMTVSELTGKIERTLKSGMPGRVLVQGEMSNFKAHGSSGHLYFTLKDDSACLNCVMWKSDGVRLKFKPADGMELLAGGTIGVYAQQGRYQLYVTSLQPLGQGALELALQQMRKKLEAEGLLAPERKKPLPAYPRNVAIVTNRQTAALADILKVLRRFRWLRLMVYHVPVQGDGAARRIA